MGLDPSPLHEPGTEVLKSCVHFLEVVVVRIHKIVLILHSTVVKALLRDCMSEFLPEGSLADLWRIFGGSLADLLKKKNFGSFWKNLRQMNGSSRTPIP